MPFKTIHRAISLSLIAYSSLLLFLVIFAMLFSSSGSNKAMSKSATESSTKNTLSLTQDGVIWGPHKILLRPGCVKVMDLSSRLDFVTKAPVWNLLIISHSHKNFFEVLPSKYKGASQGRLVLLLGDDVLNKKFTRGEQVENTGIAATRYSIKLGRPYDGAAIADAQVARGKSITRTMDVLIQNAVPIPEKALPALTKLYGIKVDGVPLKITWVKENGDLSVSVRTSRADKIHTGDSEFLPPPGYTHAKNLNDVLENPDEQSLLDLGTEFKPAKNNAH